MEAIVVAITDMREANVYASAVNRWLPLRLGCDLVLMAGRKNVEKLGTVQANYNITHCLAAQFPGEVP